MQAWTDDDRRAAVALALMPEFRGRTHLLQPFLDRPARLWQDPKPRARLPLPLLERLRSPERLDQAEVVIRESRQRGYRVVGYGDPEFPELLRHIPHPPLVLWVAGSTPLPTGPALAVVGSRRATGYGRNAVDYLLTPLASLALTLISGLARGIDACAHRWALQHDVPTLAVLGHGLDHTYPREHRRLRRDILDQGGWLVSEYPPATPPRPEWFPIRNRLIAGLAHVVLVVEAPPQSGALNTARWAVDQGREVLAVPGSIFQTTSLGTNGLIQQGTARLAQSWRDIYRAFPEWARPPAPTQPRLEPAVGTADPLRRHILDRLRPDQPTSIEDLMQWAQQQAIPVDRLYQALMELELEGQILSLPGRQYLKKPENTSSI